MSSSFSSFFLFVFISAFFFFLDKFSIQIFCLSWIFCLLYFFAFIPLSHYQEFKSLSSSPLQSGDLSPRAFYPQLQPGSYIWCTAIILRLPLMAHSYYPEGCFSPVNKGRSTVSYSLLMSSSWRESSFI